MAKHVTVSEEDIDTYITESQKEKSIEHKENVTLIWVLRNSACLAIGWRTKK